MTNAVNFVTFCKDPSAQVMTVTWDKLDWIYKESDYKSPKSPPTIPDLTNSDFCELLQGKGDPNLAKIRFPAEFHEFIDKCYAPAHLRRLSDKDIEIFLAKVAKPQATQDEIIHGLPDWLRDLHEAFSPQLADVLPPH
jgi:hypothetical protein